MYLLRLGDTGIISRLRCVIIHVTNKKYIFLQCIVRDENDNENDNEKKCIAKVVQNTVHGIHIKTDKQEKTYWRINFDKGAAVELMCPKFI